ncbi:MAG: ABC transporter ATP-binding protein/permease [Lactobacillaceae bacterium]|jgi:ATP-binding cassette subfamily B multidrug efflux pump|nr:ABC transporter ATP-binding protein/permease [Lactobacillaceae bacterium]
MSILKPYIKKYWYLVVVAVIAVSFSALAALWQPQLLSKVITAINDKNMDKVTEYGWQLVAIAIGGLVLGVVNAFFAARFSQNVAADVRENTYKKIQGFSFANIEKFSAGNLVVRMTNDVQQVQNLSMLILQNIFRIPVLLIGGIILSVQAIHQLWWVIVVMFVLILIILGAIFPQMGKRFGMMQRFIDAINTKAKENLQGVRVVKSFNQQENQEKSFNETSDDMTKLNIGIGYLFAIVMPAFMFIGQGLVSLSIYLVAKITETDPDMKMVANITSFTQYLMQIMFALIIGGVSITFASRGMVSLGRIKEVLDTENDLVFKDVPEENLDGSVEFNDVTFEYPTDEEPTLRNVTFSIKSGETIGIVGATGAGKSSLSQLIPRLFDPQSGSIKVGGVDLRDVNESSLRKAVKLVSQKATLFSGTIAENLRQGKPDATLEDLKWAADIAQASEFIEKYPDTYDHEVEERSANFSGGQKQRISIARGLIGRPSILILDDSTSALDARSEKLVQEGLATQLKGTTVITIAEKISSVINANRIIVMENGTIESIGTHKQLLKKSKTYKEIYETQKAQEDK